MLKYFRYGFYLLAVFTAALISNTVLFTYEPYPASEAGETPPLNAERALDNLAGAIRIPTVSGPDADPARFLELHRYLEDTFPAVHHELEQEVISSYSLLYHWRGSDPDLEPVLLMAHLDVVPVAPESLSRWTYPPYSGTVADGEIWGRGALDIKSGVVGIFEAVETLLNQGFAPKRSVYLAFGHDEETGGAQGAARIAALLRERKRRFAYILDEGGSIVGGGMIPGVETPVALIGVAEKGYLSLRLSASGRGGHASTPPRHTAIGRLAAAITRLENQPFPANMTLSHTTFSRVGPRMPFLQKMFFANMWLTEPLVETILSSSPATNASIRTTTAVTLISGGVTDNVLPDTATAVVNFRIMPGETTATVTARARDVIDDPDIDVQALEGGNDPSEISTADSPYFKLLARTIQRIEPHPALVVTPYLVVGGTDAKHYRGLSEAIYRFTFNHYTPETLLLMHGVNERTSVKSYLDNIRFIHQLIRNGDSRVE